ncbi:hypothetical protein ACVIHI_008365 [Bradyrhizobium sp. USDA 4524]|uniref:hypothetical protein n=1 Tax=Bradyrhizobium TaxID=374 RepID=UPI00159F1C37|nr:MULTISPECIES: hypothetical protein [Bradyrhizobium]MCP1838710.1 hypothetical protein [Bradyrhizobium sp. USDA 4538]MCP1899276.1 hypothetical protein [Bradyrhizobium sp. USDA 4537]MCP1986612.1 hypothetical protein [Bradyrhizobium sp. USDA 4539]
MELNAVKAVQISFDLPFCLLLGRLTGWLKSVAEWALGAKFKRWHGAYCINLNEGGC